MAAIYRTLLDEIERDGYRVLTQRIALTPVRKLWIAWKTWMRAGPAAGLNVRVAVVGAGWAGIGAALRLVGAGHRSPWSTPRPPPAAAPGASARHGTAVATDGR